MAFLLSLSLRAKFGTQRHFSRRYSFALSEDKEKFTPSFEDL